ncbi:MAG: hypothetical protein GY953_31805, partial [bacterium]|nr:hypothetical protein [bacterium]
MDLVDARNALPSGAGAGASGRRQKKIVPLVEFLLTHDKPRPLSARPKALAIKLAVVNQAIRLLGQAYVHLPLKRVRHAVNPVERLEALRRRLPGINERAFHNEMIDIFKDLRDAHTNYGLPPPYRRAVAFLPFRMEAYWERRQRRFLVTQTLADFELGDFRRGAEVTSWNGMPTGWAVARNAEREEGNNTAARFAFGLASMTVRPLTFTPPPSGGHVTIGYRLPEDTAEVEREILLPWSVWRG